jgi:hypothetical protein
MQDDMPPYWKPRRKRRVSLLAVLGLAAAALAIGASLLVGASAVSAPSCRPAGAHR